MSWDWNPLYPANEDVDPLEEAAREAEWEDDMRRTKKHDDLDEDDTKK